MFPYCNRSLEQCYNLRNYCNPEVLLELCSTDVYNNIYIAVTISTMIITLLGIILLVYANYIAWVYIKTSLMKIVWITEFIGFILKCIISQDPAGVLFNTLPYLEKDILGAFSNPLILTGAFLSIFSFFEIIIASDSLLQSKFKVAIILSIIIGVLLLIVNFVLLILSFVIGSTDFLNTIDTIDNIISLVELVFILIAFPIIVWRLESMNIGQSKKFFLKLKVGTVLIYVGVLDLFLYYIIVYLFSDPGIVLINLIINDLAYIIEFVAQIIFLFPAKYFSKIICCLKEE